MEFKGRFTDSIPQRKESADSRNPFNALSYLLNSWSRSASLGVYATNKWLYHKENREAFLKGDVYGESPTASGNVLRPVTASFVPTKNCNHRCCTCPYSGRRDDTAMDPHFGKHALRQLKEAGVKGVIFTGGGEPLFNRYTYRLMREAKKLGFSIGLFTNGVLLDPDLSKLMFTSLQPNLKFIRVSLNTTQRAAYKRFHDCNDAAYERVIRNIRAASEFLRDRKDIGTRFGLGFIVNEANVESLESAGVLLGELARNGRIDHAAFRPAVNYGGRALPQQSPEVLAVMEMLFENEILPRLDGENAQSGLDPVLVTERFLDLHDPQQLHCDACIAHPWRTTVWPDGGVYTCDEHNGDDRFLFGNLKESSFAEIWKGDRRGEVIRMLNTGGFGALCPPTCVLSFMNRQFQKILSIPDKQLKFLIKNIFKDLKEDRVRRPPDLEFL